MSLLETIQTVPESKGMGVYTQHHFHNGTHPKPGLSPPSEVHTPQEWGPNGCQMLNCSCSAPQHELGQPSQKTGWHSFVLIFTTQPADQNIYTGWGTRGTGFYPFLYLFPFPKLLIIIMIQVRKIIAPTAHTYCILRMRHTLLLLSMDGLTSSSQWFDVVSTHSVPISQIRKLRHGNEELV